jgi:hypothetical protein
MSITLNTSNGFVPTSQVGGKKGLHWKKDSGSSATLNGSGLSDGLAVNVLFPQQSKNPTIQWTGTTTGTNSDGTQTTVNPLTEQLNNDGPGSEQDTDVTVSVTATDTSTQQSSNTVTPTVPVGQ